MRADYYLEIQNFRKAIEIWYDLENISKPKHIFSFLIIKIGNYAFLRNTKRKRIIHMKN